MLDSSVEMRRAEVHASPTLAANEVMARRRLAGQPVLALAFGEAGLPVLPVLREKLICHADANGYGPVAGIPELRTAAAGYWERRGVPTSPEQVVSGPGSKALLYALIQVVGGDVALPQPSWVSYVAQAQLAGRRPVFVPIRPGEGGVPDPDELSGAITTARAAGRRIGSVVLTLPDNPTGTQASTETIRALCAVAERHNLVVICDEIYRDLLFPGEPSVVGPAEIVPHRTVVTTGLSKNLALGGWRLGVARLPDGEFGHRLYRDVVAAASEIWSSPAQPVQWAAAYAFTEPPEVRSRIEDSRALYARVTGAVADRFRAVGCDVPTPRAAFYLYPDFAGHRGRLRDQWSVHTGPELAELLLCRYGMGVLPGSAFGDTDHALRLRIATSQLLGDTPDQRETALAAKDPLDAPWIGAALDRLQDVLAELT
jgi:aspartate aminotransferase